MQLRLRDPPGGAFEGMGAQDGAQGGLHARVLVPLRAPRAPYRAPEQEGERKRAEPGAAAQCAQRDAEQLPRPRQRPPCPARRLEQRRLERARGRGAGEAEGADDDVGGGGEESADAGCECGHACEGEGGREDDVAHPKQERRREREQHRARELPREQSRLELGHPFAQFRQLVGMLRAQRGLALTMALRRRRQLRRVCARLQGERHVGGHPRMVGLRFRIGFRNDFKLMRHIGVHGSRRRLAGSRIGMGRLGGCGR